MWFGKSAALTLSALLALSGCGGGGSESETPITENFKESVVINGTAEKGPFTIGSKVIINGLTDSANVSGVITETETIDDLGRFSFSVEMEELLQITSTGYFRNEITGSLSDDTLTLNAIYKVSSEPEQVANINLLTHFTSKRALGLIQNEGLSFDDAVLRAETEFLESFSQVILSKGDTNFTSQSIFDDKAQVNSAYLLVVSSAVYQYSINRSVESGTSPHIELTKIINEIEQDFTEDGSIDDSDKVSLLRKTQTQLNPTKLVEISNSWINGIGYSVLDLSYYIDSDLDGVTNDNDLDDDNDGVLDGEDLSPYTPSFTVKNQSLSSIEDMQIKINVKANNPLSKTTQLSLITNPEFGELTGSYPELTYTPNPNFFGKDSFVYKLTEENLISPSVNVDITVMTVNDSPVISGQIPKSIQASEFYEFLPIAIDVDSDMLTFSIENMPQWAQFNEQDGSLTGMPNNTDVGIYKNIIISVSDNEFKQALEPFAVTVSYSDLLPPSELDSSIDIRFPEPSRIILNWNTIEYAQAYDVEISSDLDFNNIEYSFNTANTSYSFEAKIGSYYWRLRTLNPDGIFGEWSVSKPLNVGVFDVVFSGVRDEKAKKILPTDNGGFIVLASTNSPDILESADYLGDDWIFQVDGTGKLIWEYFHQANGAPQFTDLITLSDGSIIVTGLDRAESNTFALKLSESGYKEWDTSFKPENHSDSVRLSNVVEYNGELVITSTYDSAAVLHVLDLKNGNELEKINVPEIPNHEIKNVRSLTVTSNGKLAIVGNVTVIEYDSSQVIEPYGIFFQILDVNFTQEFLWTEAGSMIHSSVNKVLELPSGKFALIGNDGIAISLSIVDPETIFSETVYFRDYYYFDFVVGKTENLFGLFLRNDGELSLVSIDSTLELTELYEFKDLIEPTVSSPTLLFNEDGTFTFSLNETQNGNYDIKLQKKLL